MNAITATVPSLPGRWEFNAELVAALPMAAVRRINAAPRWVFWVHLQVPGDTPCDGFDVMAAPLRILQAAGVAVTASLAEVRVTRYAGPLARTSLIFELKDA